MKVNEIFKSIQGESSWQGYPCIFIRLSGCNLRCRWCDTKYAYENGNEISVDEVINSVGTIHESPLLVEITGGEPLLQPEVYELSEKLLDKGYKVLIDTNGSIPADKLDSRAIRIIDIKCPNSGMSDKTHWDNLKNLRTTDEIKFVLSDKRDYDWAKDVIKKYGLLDQVNRQPKILFSPVVRTIHELPLHSIAEWILCDNLPVQLQVQLHKYIGVR